MKKLIYLGFLILHLNKMQINEFWYDYINERYINKMQINKF